MNPSVLWKTWILSTLWILHILILVRSEMESIGLFMTFQSPLNLNQKLILALNWLCLLVALLLEFGEIGAFQKCTLRPRFYLCSQAFKFIVWTWRFYIIYGQWIRYMLGANYWLPVIVEWSTFLAGFVYALYVFYKHKRREREFFLSHAREDFYFDDIGEESLSPYKLPVRINSASEIRADTPVLVALVQWLYADPSWVSQSSLNIIRLPIFALRYIVMFVPITLCIPFFSYFKMSSNRRQLTTHRLARENRDYPQACMTRHEPYTDLPSSALETETTDGHAYHTDALSLHSVNPDTQIQRTRGITGQQRTMSPTRLLGPRYLCFLTEPHAGNSEHSYIVRKVSDWLAQHHSSALPDYVFISYTRRQFFTEDVSRQDRTSSTFQTRKIAADRDRSTLIDYGIAAAKRAGVPAFWVDFECVQPEQENDEEADMDDVYRICDIVRAAHSLSIVLGPSLDQSLEHISRDLRGQSEWILEWGQRLWTVPEALLCPSEHRIAIYAAPSSEPEIIAKRNLAGRVWDDAGALRQLIDHYEASLQLTQLELISIALECLQRRQTEQRNAGDVAYVLMGLLRLRPKIVKTDSDFQAFARLSLANDSDMILERIICLKSIDANSAWHDMKDFWDAKLWHIEPLYQVAGVAVNNAVTVVDVSGTCIDWASLKLVDSDGPSRQGGYRWNFLTFATGIAFMTSGMVVSIRFFLLPFITSVSRQNRGAELAVESFFATASKVFLLVFLVAALPLPALFSWLLRSERSNTQAYMFGVEGTPDLGTVEALIFGLNAHRLKWNPDVPRDYSINDGQKEFTLIDTLTCTATPLRATKHPTLAFVGGRERGMLRVLLCSYDINAAAFVKAAVLRMDSSLLRRMPRLDRFNFSIEPKLSRPSTPSHLSIESDMMDIPDIPEFRSLEPLGNT